MKKILPAVVFLLIVAVGGAAVYLVQKPGRGAGTTTAAVAFLPADTLVLLSLPDLDHTCADWKTTDLYQIWQEPEVQAFLAKPLSKNPPPPAWGETWNQVSRLNPTNLFVAVTALDAGNNRPHVVAGFQFAGSSTDVDRLLATPKELLKNKAPSGKADLVAYQGHSIETYDMGDAQTIASAYVGNWYFVGNDVSLLKSTIDRAEHRGPAVPSLDKDPMYGAVMAKLPPEHESLFFVRTRPLLDLIFNLTAASGQPVDPKQRAQAEKLQAVGATTGIENGKIRDVMYVLAPDATRDIPKFKMDGLALATLDTVLYAGWAYQLPPPQLPGAAPTPDPLAALGALGPLAGLQQTFAMLQAHGITLDSYRAAFGNELTAQLDWPAGSVQPALLLSVDVRDVAAATKFVDTLTNALDAEAAWQTSQADGRTFHSMNVPNLPALSPTLTSTDHHLIFGLSLADVQAAAKRDKAPAPNFTQSEVYKSAAAAVIKPNVDFSYIDTKTLFERTYGVLKPMALLGSAFLFPQANQYVDLGKLPEPESISRHLSPMVYAQTSDSQGMLAESVGSITYGEAAFGLLGGAGAIAAPMIGAQMNPGNSAVAPPIVAPVAPVPPPPANLPNSGPGTTPQPSNGE